MTSLLNNLTVLENQNPAVSGLVFPVKDDFVANSQVRVGNCLYVAGQQVILALRTYRDLPRVDGQSTDLSVLSQGSAKPFGCPFR